MSSINDKLDCSCNIVPESRNFKENHYLKNENNNNKHNKFSQYPKWVTAHIMMVQ